jgi:hypothetical protein
MPREGSARRAARGLEHDPKNGHRFSEEIMLKQRAAIMAENLPATSDTARSRFRSVITTVLLVLISVMIVWDILVRRWTSPSPPAPDTTQHFR